MDVKNTHSVTKTEISVFGRQSLDAERRRSPSLAGKVLSSDYQNLHFSKSEDFSIFLNALAFLLNLMSGLRSFHILEPLIQILNAFLEVLLNLTLKLRVLFFVLCIVMAVINFFEVGQQIFR